MDQKQCPGCEEPVTDKLPPCPLQCRTVQCKSYQRKSKFDPKKKPIVWILGGPGCGKHTQCNKIVQAYGFTHISIGDILRKEAARGSTRARCLNSVMTRGGLVPNDIVLAVLKEAMEKAAEEGTRGYLVDGFPSEKSQGKEFEKTVGPVSLILYLEASAETLIKRMEERGKASDRKDDDPEVTKLRLETFFKNNKSVIEPYRRRVVKINAEQTPDAIFTEVRKAMDSLMARVAFVE